MAVLWEHLAHDYIASSQRLAGNYYAEWEVPRGREGEEAFCQQTTVACNGTGEVL